MSSEHLQTLSMVPLFDTLEEAEIEELSNLLGVKEFAPGDDILTEGKPAWAMYVILDGEVAVIKTREDDEDVIAELHTGEVVGELEMIDASPCSATVRATSPVKTVLMSKNNFEAFLRLNPVAATKIMRQMVHIMAARLRESNVNYSSLMAITESM